MSDDADRQKARRLMMAALDDEITREEREALERMIREDPATRDEWDRLSRVKEVTSTMTFREPPPEVWDRFWIGAYNRVERGIGWILLSVGILVLAGYAVWTWFETLWADTAMPLFLKLALFAVAFGLIVLCVSVLREKLFTHRHDAYKEIQR